MEPLAIIANIPPVTPFHGLAVRVAPASIVTYVY